MDLLEAHAKVDKATFVKLSAEGKIKESSAELNNNPNSNEQMVTKGANPA
jgi:hypothetical protein